MMDVPVGDRFATLTEPLLVDAGAAGNLAFVKIPPAAKRVTILQGEQGTPAVFDFLQGLDFSLFQSVALAQAAVNPLTRNSGKVEIPGNACYIAISNPDPATDRIFSFVFDLEF